MARFNGRNEAGRKRADGGRAGGRAGRRLRPTVSPRSQGPRGPRQGPCAPASHPCRHGGRPHGTGEARCTPRGHQKDVDGTPGSGSSSEAERGPPGVPPSPLGSHRGPLPGRPHLMGRQRVPGSHASPTRTTSETVRTTRNSLVFLVCGGRGRKGPRLRRLPERARLRVAPRVLPGPRRESPQKDR